MPQLKTTLVMFSILLLAIFIVGCARNPTSTEAEQCRNLLETAYVELDKAKAEHFSGVADVTTAASLLTAATIQKQFSKYPNCIDKAQRARALLKPYVKS